MSQEKCFHISTLSDNIILIIKENSIITYRNPQFKPIFESQTFFSRTAIEKSVIKQYMLVGQIIKSLCLSACKKFLLIMTVKKSQSAGKGLYILNYASIIKELKENDNLNTLLSKYHIPVSDSILSAFEDIAQNNYSLSTENSQKQQYILSPVQNKIIRVLKICKAQPYQCIDSQLQIEGAIDNFLPIFVTQCADKFLVVRNSGETHRIYLCKLMGEKKATVFHRNNKINITHSELSIKYNFIKNQFREFQIIALADSIDNKALACLVKSQKSTRSGPIHEIALVIIDRFSSNQNTPYEVGLQTFSVKQILKTKIISFDQDGRLGIDKIQQVQKGSIQWQQNTVVLNINNKLYFWQNSEQKGQFMSCELSNQQTYISNTLEKSAGNYRVIISKNSALFNFNLSKNLKKKLQSSGSSSKSNQQRLKFQDHLETPKKKKMEEAPIIKQTIEMDIDVPDTLVKTMTFGDLKSQQQPRKPFNKQLSQIKQFPDMQQSKHSVTSDIFSSPGRTIKIAESNPFKKMKEPLIKRVQQEQVQQSDSSPYKIIQKKQNENQLIKSIEQLEIDFNSFCNQKCKQLEIIQNQINFSKYSSLNMIQILHNIRQTKKIAEKLKNRTNTIQKQIDQWIYEADMNNMGARNLRQTFQKFLRKNQLKDNKRSEKFWKGYVIELKRHLMDSKFRYQRIKEQHEQLKTSRAIFRCSRTVQPKTNKKIENDKNSVVKTVKKRVDFRSQQQIIEAETMRQNKQLQRPSVFKQNRKIQLQDFLPIPRKFKTTFSKPLIDLPKIQ